MIYLTDLIAWVLVHVGALYLITESSIFSPVRRLLTYGLKPNSLLVSLIYCTGCCGFWLGLLEGWAGMTIFCPPEERVLGDALSLSRVMTDPIALVVLTGFAGMGLGAWWGTKRDAIALMFHLEQGWKNARENRDDDARESETRAGREPRERGEHGGAPELGDAAQPERAAGPGDRVAAAGDPRSVAAGERSAGADRPHGDG